MAAAETSAFCWACRKDAEVSCGTVGAVNGMVAVGALPKTTGTGSPCKPAAAEVNTCDEVGAQVQGRPSMLHLNERPCFDRSAISGGDAAPQSAHLRGSCGLIQSSSESMVLSILPACTLLTAFGIGARVLCPSFLLFPLVRSFFSQTSILCNFASLSACVSLCWWKSRM